MPKRPDPPRKVVLNNGTVIQEQERVAEGLVWKEPMTPLANIPDDELHKVQLWWKPFSSRNARAVVSNIEELSEQMTRWDKRPNNNKKREILERLLILRGTPLPTTTSLPVQSVTHQSIIADILSLISKVTQNKHLFQQGTPLEVETMATALLTVLGISAVPSTSQPSILQNVTKEPTVVEESPLFQKTPERGLFEEGLFLLIVSKREIKQNGTRLLWSLEDKDLLVEAKFVFGLSMQRLSSILDVPPSSVGKVLRRHMTQQDIDITTFPLDKWTPSWFKNDKLIDQMISDFEDGIPLSKCLRIS